ncbi:MAG: hypothetical protein AAF581_08645 [Planctomycetota bacterium]
MVKKTAKKKKKKAKAKANGSVADPNAHLHQVRQLLFGEQMTALERMLETMQKGVQKDINALRRELRSEIKGSQAETSKALAEIGKQIDRLGAEQVECDEKQSRRADSNKKMLGRRIATLETETSQRLRTIRERITSTSGKLSDQVAEKTTSLWNEFNGEISELQQATVTRESMAKLFDELSKQLSK